MIVDGRAGEVDADGSAYFGLVSPVYSNVDVWLPSDPLLAGKPEASQCYLRPMPEINDWGDMGAQYTDSASYRLFPSTAEIRGVPLRATLKQFEGRWSGFLRGTLDGSLGVQRRRIPSGEDGSGGFDETMFTEDSWLENNLGVDLSPCYLIWAKRDTFTRLRGSILGHIAASGKRSDNGCASSVSWRRGSGSMCSIRSIAHLPGKVVGRNKWKDIRGLKGLSD